MHSDVSWAMPASTVCPPVASTSPSAAPEVMYVPAKARSPARSAAGTLSPVKVEASTLTSSAVARVMSAGTRSPGDSTTTSPTTTSAASTISGWPSRRTTTAAGSRSRRRSAARSARCSWTNANTPLTMMTTRIATPSCGMPATTASTPATQSMRAKKWVNWAANLRHVCAAGGGGSRFGPSAASRSAASADVRPGLSRSADSSPIVIRTIVARWRARQRVKGRCRRMTG